MRNEVENNSEWCFANLISLLRIQIPLVQRAYVQGRQSAREVREHFVNSILSAIAGKSDPLTLYFIYGKVKDDCFIPLDGQQRLTTLFLLHWYFRALPEGIKGFVYESRRMATEFVAWLIAMRGGREMCSAPREWIVRQSSFVPAWESDESVVGMLATLDTIHAIAQEMKLHNVNLGNVVFRIHFVGEDVDSGETYLKINARGEALTPWENIKSIIDASARQNADGDKWLANINGRWLGYIEQYLPEIPAADTELEGYIEDSCGKLNAAFRNLIDLSFLLCNNDRDQDKVDLFHTHKATYQLYRDKVGKDVLRIASELFAMLGDKDLCINSWTRDRSANVLWVELNVCKDQSNLFPQFLFDMTENQSQFTYYRALRYAVIAHYRCSSAYESIMGRVAVTRALNILDSYSIGSINHVNVCRLYRELSTIVDDLDSFSEDNSANKTNVRDAEKFKASLFCKQGYWGYLLIEADCRFCLFKGNIEFAYDSDVGIYTFAAAEFFYNNFMSISTPVQENARFKALMSRIREFSGDAQGLIQFPEEDNGSSNWTNFLFSISVKNAYEEMRRDNNLGFVLNTDSVPSWINAYFQVAKRYPVIKLGRHWKAGGSRIFAFQTKTMKGQNNKNALIDLCNLAQRFMLRDLRLCVNDKRPYLLWCECEPPYFELLSEKDRYIKLDDLIALNDDSKSIATYALKDGEYVDDGRSYDLIGYLDASCVSS